MKILQLFLFLFFHFLPFIASRPFPLPAVIGLDGRELKLGESYSMLTSFFPGVVGVCLVDNAPCPDDVIECPGYYDNTRGSPVTFSAVNSTEDTIVRENTPYRIAFTVGGDCSEVGNMWYFKGGDNPILQDVAIGPETDAVEFVIQREPLGYRIVYNVGIPIPPITFSYGVGFISQNGYNRLGIGIGVNPVPFFFGNSTSDSTVLNYKLALL